MIPLRRLFREAARCVLAGPSLASMGRRLAFAPLRLWLTNPRRALLFVAVDTMSDLIRAREYLEGRNSG